MFTHPPGGHMAERRVGVEYSPSMLETVRPGAVSQGKGKSRLLPALGPREGRLFLEAAALMRLELGKHGFHLLCPIALGSLVTGPSQSGTTRVRGSPEGHRERLEPNPRCVCVFITAVPITRLFAGGGGG